MIHALRMFCSGKLHLIDGIVGYDQCHINALFVFGFYSNNEIKQYLNILSNSFPGDFQELLTSKLVTETISLEKLQKIVKFITLNFLLSSSTFNNKGKVAEMIVESGSLFAILDKKSISIGPVPLIPSRMFDLNKQKHFVCNGNLINKAKKAIGNIVFDYIGSLICQPASEIPSSSDKVDGIMSELGAFFKTEEIKTTNLGIPVYPKYLGAELFVKKIQVEHIPIVVKVKCICEHGVHIYTHIISDSQNYLFSSSPVIVIEGSSHYSKSLSEIDTAKESCYNHCLIRNNKSVQHSQTGHCFLCKPHNDESCPYFMTQKNYLLEHLKDLDFFLNISAAFCKEKQPEYFELVTKQDSKYPFLKEKFLTSLNLGLNGFNSEDMSVFYIEHLYADNLRHALNSPRLIDVSSK